MSINLTKKSRDQGTFVAKVQEALNEAFQEPRLVVDGDYWSKTETAVKEFQGDKQLTVDGEAGKNTQTALGLDFSGFRKNPGGIHKSCSWLLPRNGSGFRIYNPEGTNPIGSKDQFGKKRND